MESRRRSPSSRRPVLNELSRLSADLDHSSEYIFIDDNDYANNDRNILNNQSTSSTRSIPEEEIIKTRGRKKVKCSPSLRDLSPNSLATLKTPIKNPVNETLLKFLRSPTPRKAKVGLDAECNSEIKKARKSLSVELEITSVKCSTSTPTLASSKKKQVKKTPNKKKKFFNLRRSTNIKT